MCNRVMFWCYTKCSKIDYAPFQNPHVHVCFSSALLLPLKEVSVAMQVLLYTQIPGLKEPSITCPTSSWEAECQLVLPLLDSLAGISGDEQLAVDQDGISCLTQTW